MVCCNSTSPVIRAEREADLGTPEFTKPSCLEIMNIRTAFIFAIPLFLSLTSRAEPLNFVGTVVPPRPNGCSFQEGGVLGRGDAFAYERLLCGKQEVLVFLKFIERRGKVAYWKTIDQVTLPAMKAGQQVLDTSFCSSNVYKGNSIFAIGQWRQSGGDTFKAEAVLHAWRFNLALGKIESIPTGSVSCETEGNTD